MIIEKDNYSEKVLHNDKIMAVIIRSQGVEKLGEAGENFFFPTPQDFPFQFGVQKRSAGEIVEPHFHLPFPDLKDLPVQEFFYIISGKVRIDVYYEADDSKIGEVILNQGDSIIMNTGHGLEFLEEGKLLVLKQGPYRGRNEEKRFF